MYLYGTDLSAEKASWKHQMWDLKCSSLVHWYKDKNTRAIWLLLTGSAKLSSGEHSNAGERIVSVFRSSPRLPAFSRSRWPAYVTHPSVPRQPGIIRPRRHPASDDTNKDTHVTPFPTHKMVKVEIVEEKDPQATHSSPYLSPTSSHTSSSVSLSSVESESDSPVDESLLDRLAALKDIVPPTTRHSLTSKLSNTASFLKRTTKIAGNVIWVVTTSALLIGLPLALILEDEAKVVAQENEMLAQQQGAQQVRARSFLPHILSFLTVPSFRWSQAVPCTLPPPTPPNRAASRALFHQAFELLFSPHTQYYRFMSGRSFCHTHPINAPMPLRPQFAFYCCVTSPGPFRPS